MRVIVFGATGYLGARICQDLIHRKMQVIGVSHREPSNYGQWKNGPGQLLVGDVTSSALFERLAKIDTDAVVHTVSLNHSTSETDIHQAMGTNVLSALRALEFAEKKGCRRFIYLSTQQVYGRECRGHVDESSAVSPENIYGLTHHLSEQLVDYYRRKSRLGCVSLRISNGYGSPVLASANCWTLVANDLCRMAVEKGELRLQGNGTPQRDFIHVVEIAKTVSHFLTCKDETLLDGVFQLGSSESRTIVELAGIISRAAELSIGKTFPVFLGDGTRADLKKPRLDVQERFNYSSVKLRSAGLSPTLSLAEGIEELLRYCVRTFSPKEIGRPKRSGTHG